MQMSLRDAKIPFLSIDLYWQRAWKGCHLQPVEWCTCMQGSSAAGTGYGGASGYGQSGYGSNAQAADTSSNFGGNMGTAGYGNDTAGYGSSAYGQVSPLRCA